jgi:hypothetical protein
MWPFRKKTEAMGFYVFVSIETGDLTNNVTLDGLRTYAKWYLHVSLSVHAHLRIHVSMRRACNDCTHYSQRACWSNFEENSDARNWECTSLEWSIRKTKTVRIFGTRTWISERSSDVSCERRWVDSSRSCAEKLLLCSRVLPRIKPLFLWSMLII